MKRIKCNNLLEDHICEVIREVYHNGSIIVFNHVRYWAPQTINEDGYITINKPNHKNTVEGLYIAFEDALRNKGYITAYTLVNELTMKEFYIVED